MKLLATLCACTALIGCAQTPKLAAHGDAALALRWVHAIEQEDWDTLGELLHEDAVYEDPTMMHYGSDPIYWIGRDSIVDFWRRSDEDSGSRNIDYRIDGYFETGGVTVLTMYLSLEISGAFWDIDQDFIPVSGSQTTVVTCSDGKIMHVIDYVDYAEGDRQINALRDKHGEARLSEGTLPGNDEL